MSPAPDIKAQLLEAWEVHQRVNLALLDLVQEERMQDKYAARTREVSKVFSHIHNTRIMWLDAMGMQPEGVRKIDKGASPKADAIRTALVASGDAVGQMLLAVAGKDKVPGFKRSPATFMAYLIAHEAHHRGQIIVSLRASGHPLSAEQIYGLWEWDKI